MTPKNKGRLEEIKKSLPTNWTKSVSILTDDLTFLITALESSWVREEIAREALMEYANRAAYWWDTSGDLDLVRTRAIAKIAIKKMDET